MLYFLFLDDFIKFSQVLKAIFLGLNSFLTLLDHISEPWKFFQVSYALFLVLKWLTNSTDFVPYSQISQMWCFLWNDGVGWKKKMDFALMTALNSAMKILFRSPQTSKLIFFTQSHDISDFVYWSQSFSHVPSVIFQNLILELFSSSTGFVPHYQIIFKRPRAIFLNLESWYLSMLVIEELKIVN
jgi:hypothetical protein